MYVQSLFEKGQRTVHMGVDVAAPVGTPVRSFFEGEIFMYADNDRAGDYGPTIITRHVLDGHELYALYGHLSRTDLKRLEKGKWIHTGDQIGTVGRREENGGWNPHVHFQLSWLRPEVPDLPGVVNPADREWARTVFPDPRLVLGPLY